MTHYVFAVPVTALVFVELEQQADEAAILAAEAAVNDLRGEIHRLSPSVDHHTYQAELRISDSMAAPEIIEVYDE